MTDPGHTERLWQSSDLFHHAVHRFPLPLIAAVDGIAYAGGFDLAVLCDLLRNKAKFTARSAISPGTPTLDL